MMSDMIKSTKIICLAIVLTLFLTGPGLASNDDYAALPPFLSASVDPNALLVMDFSGSMQQPAYYPGELYYYYSSGVAIYSGDDYNWTYIYRNYDHGKQYYGYFDSSAYYTYNSNPNDSNKGYWEVDNYTGTGAGHVSSGLSGNFLNFLVMSRIDVALKSLIGGKAECPDTNSCILRPQGSRRYLIDSGLDVDCHIRPDGEYGYTNKDMLISIRDQYGHNSNIGNIYDAYARVKIDSHERQGIVQQNEGKVRFGFIAYADSNNNTAEQGLIKYGFHHDNIDDLIDALQTTVPYQGTHTGEAMREGYRYLIQSNLNNDNDDDYEDPGSIVDPYYQAKYDADGNQIGIDPAWCRESYVILISDGEWNGSEDPDEWAHKMHTEDLRSSEDFPGKQNASVYTLFCFSESDQGEQSMKTVAAFGNYEDKSTCTDGAPYDLTESDDSDDVTYPRPNCDPNNTYQDCCGEWDGDRDGVPDAFFNAKNGQVMTYALGRIFQQMQMGSASGTSVTALTARSTTGSVITQAVFYPEKEFDETHQVSWAGDLFTNWFLNSYIDGELVTNMREDSGTQDYTLELSEDRILEYEVQDGSLEINAFDSSSDGTKADDTPDETYTSVEDINYLANYGEKLRTREASTRTIYGVSESDDREEFTTSNVDDFDGLLGSSAGEYPDCLLSGGSPQYADLITYVRGEAVSGCRSRATDNNGNIWKLGDIISSSPELVNYGDYRMVYTGSNDGMLHAFRLGHIKNTGNKSQPANLCDDDPGTCTKDETRKEMWAFIPKDCMPYLRYMADPAYEHIYTTDLKPYVIDISEQDSDQTILIGGMRLGGACASGPVFPPSDAPSDVGRSAYFALDITDPEDPTYLWRFAPAGMGLTYSGPAHVKRKDDDGNYHHFLIFASGPTDYDGSSIQPLQIYVVNLKNGTLAHTHEEPNFNAAFGGRLFNEGLDLNKDKQTDFVFLGFTNKADKGYDKMTGGIYKIYTGGTNPSSDWSFDVFMSNNIGDPVTGPVLAMDCFPDVIPYPYLYFGSGRYFVSNDETGGNNDYNHLYGVPFTCDINNEGCSTISSITNSSDLDCSDVGSDNANAAAWKIPLEGKSGPFLRERCYSTPTPTNYNMVFFDTAAPTNIVCECGGRSRSWAVNCASGRGLGDDVCGENDELEGKYNPSSLPFKYLVQLSGGDIQDPEKGEFTPSTPWTDGMVGEEGGSPVFPPGSPGLIYWKQR